MGEITDLILEGVLCECCGGMVEDEIIEAAGGSVSEGGTSITGPGFPLKCESCEEEK
jgi:hypothetical protein